jgi:hypothetical protein
MHPVLAHCILLLLRQIATIYKRTMQGFEPKNSTATTDFPLKVRAYIYALFVFSVHLPSLTFA